MPAISLILSFALSLLLVPVVRRLSFKLGRVALPRADRWHHQPTPLLGGVGIFVAFLLAVLASLALGLGRGQMHWGLLLGAAIMFGFGLYDDIRQMTPQAKLTGQILAAAVVIFLGYTTGFFTPRISDSIVARLPNILLTFVWLVGITNAINLLDNMDGLAGGISFVGALFLSFFFWRAGDTGLLLISLALAGGVLGFLVFNFPPASIFMGDSGSLFLGFTLAVLAIARQPQASNVFAVMGVPTLLFLLPILDTTLVTFTRILRGQSPAQGGRDHTSHRLIAFGLSERQAVLVLYAVAVLAGVAGLAIESLSYWLSLVLVPVLVISLALLTAYLGGLKVVSTSPAAGRGTAITRLLLDLTYRRRLLEVVLDFFLIALAYYLAILIRFGFNMNTARLALYLQSLPIAVVGAYLSLFTFGVYRGVWRYVGVDDLFRYVEAALGAAVLVTAGVLLLYPGDGYSPAIFLLFGVFLFLGMAASRSSFKVLDQIGGRQVRPAEARVLICGAGDSGEMALRWIMMNPHLAYRPVGFLDQNPYLAGRQIHGVEVLGSVEQIEATLDRKQVDGVIITPDVLDNTDLGDAVLNACRQRGRWVRCLRLEFELLE